MMSEPIYIFAALGRNRKPRELESYCCEEMDGKMLPLSPLQLQVNPSGFFVCLFVCMFEWGKPKEGYTVIHCV